MSGAALFLDRDGVINLEIGDYISDEKYFEVNSQVYPIIKEANKRGYKVIVITNQGGIAKNLYSHEKLSQIHHKMYECMIENNCFIDDLFYCPHHPDFNGKCICRKPDSLMLEKAIHVYNLDKEKCLFIGDNPRDIAAAENAGIKGLHIKSNHLPEINDVFL
ncbi:MAG: HAD-IIIA family hydrolase [Bacteroidota bacterium]|jgi:D-glycero-D-manno-heptose 1,7-bisphosphate phosphatase